jgi:hypothetical protein
MEIRIILHAQRVMYTIPGWQVKYDNALQMKCFWAKIRSLHESKSLYHQILEQHRFPTYKHIHTFVSHIRYIMFNKTIIKTNFMYYIVYIKSHTNALAWKSVCDLIHSILT